MYIYFFYISATGLVYLLRKLHQESEHVLPLLLNSLALVRAPPGAIQILHEFMTTPINESDEESNSNESSWEEAQAAVFGPSNVGDEMV
jgi:hypothetical protein